LNVLSKNQGGKAIAFVTCKILLQKRCKRTKPTPSTQHTKGIVPLERRQINNRLQG